MHLNGAVTVGQQFCERGGKALGSRCAHHTLQMSVLGIGGEASINVTV